MKIICPQCGFNRDLPADRLPKTSAIATCPKCGCRFRFSRDSGAGGVLPQDNRRETADTEEDIRLTASRAYAREAGRFKEAEIPARDAKILNPWDEAPGRDGWLSAFYQTVIRVMFSAPTFFKTLSPTALQNRALLFYLIICVFQTVMEKIWGELFYALLSPTAAGDPQLEKMLAMLSPDTNFALSLLLRCGLLVCQLYLFSFLVFLAYRLVAPQKGSFSLLFQIMAYSSAPSILCLVPALGSITGMIWGLGCLAVGCKAALGLDWPRTLAGFLPLIVLFALFISQIGAILPG